jgi:hypothetical protein
MQDWAATGSGRGVTVAGLNSVTSPKAGRQLAGGGGSGRSATINHSSAADSPQAARAQGCHPAVDERSVGIMTLTVVIVLLILVCGAAAFMLWRRRRGGR